MTGTIRTLRVDKGFGFIKDDTGKEYFFPKRRTSTSIGRRRELLQRYGHDTPPGWPDPTVFPDYEAAVPDRDPTTDIKAER